MEQTAPDAHPMPAAPAAPAAPAGPPTQTPTPRMPPAPLFKLVNPVLTWLLRSTPRPGSGEGREE